jgi:hypothetical protein
MNPTSSVHRSMMPVHRWRIRSRITVIFVLLRGDQNDVIGETGLPPTPSREWWAGAETLKRLRCREMVSRICTSAICKNKRTGYVQYSVFGLPPSVPSGSIPLPLDETCRRYLSFPHPLMRDGLIDLLGP